ncbi:AmiA-like protein [Posidoniimonas corsicana]|uniref:AmiA-like protein n=1 Tax=Posidoniimonas corsicana TaxID=1938618 RepID=A0A5C5VHR8_9BACT|nr:fibronectin type III domain-containing protein [Posidoniimonas corsicana]TWT37419.1 AmiA-like protein [Posidoniimonas corsicana]
MTKRVSPQTPRLGRAARRLSLEPLEPRLALSSAGLIDIGAQPSGALDGKIVYLHGGHGYTADNLGNGSWTSQRPLLYRMVEDMGNHDQMSYLAQYLFDAGATVVPLRPVGHQPNEVVLDNDDVEVTFTGAWSDSSASIYFGDPGDVPYRFASTSSTQTAAAQYRPNISEPGFYPVYSWTRYGSDRAADQLYRVHHSGGVTEVTVNHRRVGNGTVYLGTYYFEAGTDGYVEISNESSESGRVVIADMIRFGNGVGDINRGGGVSGFDREDEAALYWIQWHVDHSQGVSTSTYRSSSEDRSATVGAAPRYAEYMNREADGDLSDRLFVSFHSNAGGGRGVVGLHNTSSGGDTPNQLFLAQTLAEQVNDDLVAQNGDFEHNWFNRTSLTYQASFNYGEINNAYIDDEFDATIVETAFHDNEFDAELMRDPRVRDAIARATYQGIVDYFHAIDSGATPDTDAPGQPTDVWVETKTAGEAVVHWTAGAANGYAGGPAAGFTVYASTNGYGFDGGRYVAGAGATSLVITGLDPAQAYFFKVVANNQGGQSPASEVVAASASGGQERVLIVNGFDRLDRSLNPTQTFVQGGLLERVRPRQSNSFDYAVQMASAIHSAAPGLSISTAANELVANGTVDLTDYDAVFWILGEESTADQTFDVSEQSAVASYLTGGGKLFVSGAEIGWELDNLGGGQSFYNNTLRAEYIADDANTYQATGAVGSIFEGINLTFDDGDLYYDTEYADVIAPSGGASPALSYGNGAGTAAVQFSQGEERVVMLAFPFETITDAAVRAEMMARVIDFFDAGGGGVPTVTIQEILDNDDGPATYTSTTGWITSSDPGYQGGTFQFNLVGGQGQAQWRTTLPLAGTAQVYVQHTAAGNRATGARFEVTSGDRSISQSVNQTANNLQWVLLGSLPVEAGELTVTLDVASSTGPANSVIVADVVRVVLTAPMPPSGDFNDDGFVDAADYTVWRDQKDQTVEPGTGADGNFDGIVDSQDYQLWRSQYGTAIVTPTPIVIDTPTAATLEQSPSVAMSPATAQEPTPTPIEPASPGQQLAPLPATATAEVVGEPVIQDIVSSERNNQLLLLFTDNPTASSSELVLVEALFDTDQSDEEEPARDAVFARFGSSEV